MGHSLDLGFQEHWGGCYWRALTSFHLGKRVTLINAVQEFRMGSAFLQFYSHCLKLWNLWEDKNQDLCLSCIIARGKICLWGTLLCCANSIFLVLSPCIHLKVFLKFMILQVIIYIFIDLVSNFYIFHVCTTSFKSVSFENMSSVTWNLVGIDF